MAQEAAAKKRKGKKLRAIFYCMLPQCRMSIIIGDSETGDTLTTNRAACDMPIYHSFFNSIYFADVLEVYAFFMTYIHCRYMAAILLLGYGMNSMRLVI